ncbi:protein phosphatase 2C domain-containing protein [Streptomyces sp. PT12]|uniref:protein phosphatase 2C domain-containing protein n=1 Tax=Streptomyces sp. PT12 TaxID=1510197 RepID=UPI00215CCD5B|nr:protein phosphatase 2C domain-containing protein [Streptomyces sp. PT12]
MLFAAERAGAPPPGVWVSGGGAQVAGLTVWTERVAGRGEDAEALAAHHRGSRGGVIAVFDGAGGAGAAPAWRAPGGESYTGAWVGARVARLATECWFREAVERAGPDGPLHGGAAAALAEELRRQLDAARPRMRGRITGSMRRVLPTTVAGLAYRLTGDAVAGQALWAGDSRAYALLPASGLHALTRDHTHLDDALEQLRADPAMTNVVCADRPFTVDAHAWTFPLPCVLLCATDGFFGYLETPARFEWVLLRTLAAAGDLAGWARLLRDEVGAYTADDATLALAAPGFGDFAALRRAFGPRHDAVRARYGGEGPEVASRGWQDAAWRSYRAGYERHMPPVREAGAR